MKFWSLGLSFKSARIDERTRAFLSEFEDVQSVVGDVDEFVWVSTCNRLELYAVGESEPETVLSNWADYRSLSTDLQSKFQIHRNFQALVHLYRVTSSLDSMVIGENQIQGQIKKAYLKAQEQGSVGPLLHKVFQSAFRSAKKIRSETEIGSLAVSVPSIGVKLAQKVLGSLSDKKIGILGLGEIGRLAAEHFGSVGPMELLLFNRTYEKVEELVSQFKKEEVKARGVRDLDQLLKESHVLVSCIDTCLISDENVSRVGENQFPAFVLDLSVPPSVNIQNSSQVLIYTVDDLQKIADENTTLRQKEQARAHKILFDEAEKLWRGLSSQNLDQTFQRLSEKMDDIRINELEILRKRLAHLPEEDWNEIVKTTKRLSQKLMQDPVMVLKSQAENRNESDTWLHFFRNMFKI